ncbi:MULTISPECIES: phosphonate C-P lyase system protein PhnH [Halomonadaceae]|jgi:alpha-D-ribose 1-methylphosphonate 5-triphosphate synthase subunit PhnH|uniref:phosphonate C-P lyase system protein PhnH n=1 Tax=Halomonadaceae TaxID=28256 RepID=UPI000A99EFA5|nr:MULTISPECIES: phosphonate C-P lyase system protein PhnH [Halomonas]MCD2088935.1 phosphonate C-P lyase system protein PhnH [Halomonas meridiana]|tara:strand:- start:552 stop:1274 length:723 start_codon:yes stop_codon:yes gene_type:complete
MHDITMELSSSEQSPHVPKPHQWPALKEAVHHSQQLFRQVLSSMAEPGTFAEVNLAPLPQDVAMSPAAWAVLLVLCDLDTRVWIADELNRDGLAEAIAFHTGARIVSRADEADFALVVPSTCQAMPRFSEGSDTYPDRSTTLIVVLESLAEARSDASQRGNTCWQLSGPGILNQRVLELDDTAEALMQRLALNRASFPLGLDTILTSGSSLTAIPRSTRIQKPLEGASPTSLTHPAKERV